ncbi:YihY/virulence factor BrkB family protein [Candidatus Epulonipiscium viviparus]|uniref:YihY/virulence factor BrkB family protein n=1 Tax=Candidatus Epulonipiscium viviparus TaxID=420336 RepID=UPI000498625C|nr:YihY/virulence factor BrkB family protein [Candidatus Epulopiscium viviparus]
MAKIKYYYYNIKKRFLNHDVSPRSAQMTYYWILAIFPFLLMIINLISYVKIDSINFMEYVPKVVPSMVAPLVESTVNSMIEKRSGTGIFVGAVLALWSTSAAVNTLIKGIYLAYGVVDSRNFVVRKLAGMMYSLLLAFILIAMVVLLIFGNKLGQYILKLFLVRYPKSYTLMWDLTRLCLSWILLISSSYFIHRVIPRRHIKNRYLWPGVFFTAISWYVFSYLFSIYVEHFSNYGSMYGSIGGIFVLLIWLYTNGLFILIGAEINAIILINKNVPYRKILNSSIQTKIFQKY